MAAIYFNWMLDTIDAMMIWQHKKWFAYDKSYWSIHKCWVIDAIYLQTMNWSTWFDTHKDMIGANLPARISSFPWVHWYPKFAPFTDFCRALRDRQGKGRLVVILSNCWTQLWLVETWCVEVAWPNIHKNKDFTIILQLFFMEQNSFDQFSEHCSVILIITNRVSWFTVYIIL